MIFTTPVAMTGVLLVLEVVKSSQEGEKGILRLRSVTGERGKGHRMGELFPTRYKAPVLIVENKKRRFLRHVVRSRSVS